MRGGLGQNREVQRFFREKFGYEGMGGEEEREDNVGPWCPGMECPGCEVCCGDEEEVKSEVKSEVKNETEVKKEAEMKRETEAKDEPAAEASAPETPSPQVDQQVIDLLGAAWKAAKRDSRGFARLSELGNIANNRSSFDARNYGFKGLSDLIESVGGQFKVERRDDGVYIKRQR